MNIKSLQHLLKIHRLTEVLAKDIGSDTFKEINMAGLRILASCSSSNREETEERALVINLFRGQL